MSTVDRFAGRRVTETDRDWWIEKSRSIPWTNAKTFSGAGAHEYAVVGKTPDWTYDDATRAAHVIRVFGQPGRFFRYPNLYFFDRETGFKFWTMSGPLVIEQENLVNRGRIDVFTGEQNLPSTTSTQPFGEFDYTATSYDLSPRNDGTWRQARKAIVEHFGGRPPRTLDVGAGTGRLYDTGAVPAGMATAVDPSQGMLNQLVLKHPSISRVIPDTFAHALSSGALQAPYDLVVLLDVARHLDREQLVAARALVRAGGLMILGPTSDGGIRTFEGKS